VTDHRPERPVASSDPGAAAGTDAGPRGAPAVSVVVPVYNERENLSPLLDEIAAALRGTSYEVIAVDDGSTDGSGEELVAQRARHPALRVVRFARNAGQSAAFAAGFRAARGAVLVTMDADLQNDPADVPALLRELERSGVDAAAGWRKDRQDTGWKLVQSRIANGVRNRLNHETIRDTGCSLKAFRREAVQDIPWFTGMHRFLPTLVKMRGGRVVEVPVRHRPRRFGATKYGMWNRVFRALADALAVRWMQRRALRYEIREISE
jgi:glycosyltransferase involved in cell wall biosynthesis